MPAGRTVPISLARQLVIDFLHASQRVPTVCMERHMRLAPVVAARATANLDQHLEDIPESMLRHLTDTWTTNASDHASMRFHATRLYAMVWATNPTTVSSAYSPTSLSNSTARAS